MDFKIDSNSDITFTVLEDLAKTEVNDKGVETVLESKKNVKSKLTVSLFSINGTKELINYKNTNTYKTKFMIFVDKIGNFVVQGNKKEFDALKEHKLTSSNYVQGFYYKGKR